MESVHTKQIDPRPCPSIHFLTGGYVFYIQGQPTAAAATPKKDPLTLDDDMEDVSLDPTADGSLFSYNICRLGRPADY